MCYSGKICTVYDILIVYIASPLIMNRGNGTARCRPAWMDVQKVQRVLHDAFYHVFFLEKKKRKEKKLSKAMSVEIRASFGL